MNLYLEEKEALACCGSTVFAKQLASAAPFCSLDHVVSIARDIWFNKVDVNGWLEAFASHPQIGDSPSSSSSSSSSPATSAHCSGRWSKGEQSTALATANASSLQELSEWNLRYKQKFGHIFLICASGRSTAEILGELKKRYSNRPIIEFEIAAQEQMKVTELRLAKLFSNKVTQAGEHHQANVTRKAEDRVSIIGGHIREVSKGPSRTRPPITTHVLDVSKGHPAAGIELLLEMWKGAQPGPMFGQVDTAGWVHQGSSTTDKDGRSGQLMSMVDALSPGVYRVSFNTGKYCPEGFFPFVSIVFQVREQQKFEHFHVPLLFSPFSFSTYRGS